MGNAGKVKEPPPAATFPLFATLPSEGHCKVAIFIDITVMFVTGPKYPM